MKKQRNIYQSKNKKKFAEVKMNWKIKFLQSERKRNKKISQSKSKRKKFVQVKMKRKVKFIQSENEEELKNLSK